MIILKDWTMRIQVKDRRCKSGWRALNTYVYKNKHEQWMVEEVRDLQIGLYPKDKYNIEFEAACPL